MITDHSKILPGDIIDLKLFINGFIRYFKGLCISVKNRSMVSRNTSLTVRNYISKNGVEFFFFFHLNIILSLNLYDYQRKRFAYRASKLFYLRNKLNRESLVF
jgi:ribosomal protein L19